MFFIIWGWRRRVLTLGVSGPYTCPSCRWVGTFWLRQVQRQLRIYWIPVMKWSRGKHYSVCRNCGNSVEINPEAVDAVVAGVQPLNAPDPWGPAGAPPLPAPEQSPQAQQPGGLPAGPAGDQQPPSWPPAG